VKKKQTGKIGIRLSFACGIAIMHQGDALSS
jgi:hypothetical protein